jgi:hypothetical protein
LELLINVNVPGPIGFIRALLEEDHQVRNVIFVLSTVSFARLAVLAAAAAIPPGSSETGSNVRTRVIGFDIGSIAPCTINSPSDLRTLPSPPQDVAHAALLTDTSLVQEEQLNVLTLMCTEIFSALPGLFLKATASTSSFCAWLVTLSAARTPIVTRPIDPAW